MTKITLQSGVKTVTTELEECDTQFICAMIELFGPGNRRYAAKLRAGAIAICYDGTRTGLILRDLLAYRAAVKESVELAAVANGDFLTYTVQSRSDPAHPNLVDLEFYELNGKCSCKDFATHMEDFLSRGGRGAPVFQCDHIRAARAQWTRDELRKQVAAWKAK